MCTHCSNVYVWWLHHTEHVVPFLSLTSKIVTLSRLSTSFTFFVYTVQTTPSDFLKWTNEKKNENSVRPIFVRSLLTISTLCCLFVFGWTKKSQAYIKQITASSYKSNDRCLNYYSGLMFFRRANRFLTLFW